MATHPHMKEYAASMGMSNMNPMVAKLSRVGRFRSMLQLEYGHMSWLSPTAFAQWTSLFVIPLNSFAVMIAMLLPFFLLNTLVAVSPFCLANLISPPTSSSQADVGANPEYQEWDTIAINLSTSFTSFRIDLYKVGNTTVGLSILSNLTEQDLPTSWISDVSHFNSSPRTVITGNSYYSRADDDKSSDSFRTHAFNVTQSSRNDSQPASITSPVAAADRTDATSLTTPPASSVSSTSAGPSASGFSGTAKAGIGFGVAVGALVISGCAAFWWRRRRAQAHLKYPGSLTNPVVREAGAGKISSDIDRSMSLGSAYSKPANAESELENRPPMVAELDNCCFREMDAGPRSPREQSNGGLV